MNPTVSSAVTSSTDPNKSITFVGYRFHPTDDELVGHFLKHKMHGHDDKKLPISEIRVCDFEPWDLPALVNNNSQDQVWYFFCPRDYKYIRSRRSNRTTKSGYWKPTGKPRKVKATRTKEEIGTKRSLVFYIKDQPKPRRTKWIMHEYECIHNSTSATQGNFLLCKLKLKKEEMINKERSSHATSTLDLQNQKSNEMVTNSSPDEYEESLCLAPERRNGDLVEMTAMSTYDYSNILDITDSTSDEGESYYYLDSEIQDSNKMTAMSTYECGKQNFLMETTTDSTSKEGESHYYLDSETKTQNPTQMNVISTCKTMDFEFQNPHQILDISEDSKDGELSHEATTASEKTDMFNSSFDIENITAEATVFEMQVDTLAALYYGLDPFLEFQDNLNAALFPPTTTDDSLSYCTTFNTSFTAGVARICS